MPRSVRVDVDDLVARLTEDPATRSGDEPGTDDDVADRILDAAAELFATVGVGRCSIDDIATRSGLGRTTVYRRFDGRQRIVEAVLARELRRFFGSILRSVAHLERFEDVVVEAFLGGLGGVEASLLTTLVRAEPELLQVLTIDGGPLIAAARSFMTAAYAATHPDGPPAGTTDDDVAIVAEVLVRLAISLVLTPETVIPAHDPLAARSALHRLLDPIVTPLG